MIVSVGARAQIGFMVPGLRSLLSKNRELFDLSGSQFKELISAVAGHTKLQRVVRPGEPTIATCWDADRLDICVGYVIDVRYLFTERAKDLAELMPDVSCMTLDEILLRDQYDQS